MTQAPKRLVWRIREQTHL